MTSPLILLITLSHPCDRGDHHQCLGLEEEEEVQC